MKKKSEKQGFSAEICVELDKIKKYGRIISKPKNYLEIGDCFANNKKTGNTKKMKFAINDKGEPIVICEKRAFYLRWIDIVAIALKHSALIQESVSMPEDTEPEENEKLHKDEISHLDEMSMNLNSEKGGEE